MTDMETIARQLIEALPFSNALGMRLEAVGEGCATISMPWDARFVGDPRSGVIHGGAVSALLDTCSGAAVAAHPDGTGITATIDLRIDYMRPATPGRALRGEAVCYHATRTVAFVRATATDGETATPVATAKGAFTFEKRKTDR
ncbi:PaaI family thioesterase [Tropicimonas sp.]|uniref:PaaI family thioesterase n=1 Tax=Tropicimonas sp. TaxID=2067044 RepID=UPI003A8BFA0C